jgi:hypothetical protein
MLDHSPIQLCQHLLLLERLISRADGTGQKESVDDVVLALLLLLLLLLLPRGTGTPSRARRGTVTEVETAAV